MSFKTILVHCTEERRLPRVLAAAIPIARRDGAHVSALSILPPVIVEPAFSPGGVVTIIDSHRKAYAKERAHMRETFETALRESALEGEWISLDNGHSSVWKEIVRFGRSADLIVAAKPDPAWTYSHMLEAPAELVLHSGRPVLFVPGHAEPGLPGRNVIVAWNGSREAARAAHDAMPFLRRASKVTVLWINPADDPAAGDLPGADLCTTLARHGVTAEAATANSPGRNPGEVLLNRARETGADLVVMGCYGHSRMKEFILGGATRHVFEEMQVSVLMSH